MACPGDAVSVYGGMPVINGGAAHTENETGLERPDEEAYIRPSVT